MPIIAHQNQIIGQATNAEALVKDTVGWTGKNLLKINMLRSPYTYNGITFTKNSDGSISVSGTSTSVMGINIAYFDVESNVKYILTGTPDDIVNPTNNYIRAHREEATYIWKVQDNGNGAVIQRTNSERIWIDIRIDSGVTINTTFYPMLRKANITDPTYEPYHESVEVMYEEEIHGVNLLKNTATSQTANGVTFTKNADGSVTANGTATAPAELVVCYDLPSLYGGRYILSGCPSGGAINKYRITAYRVDSIDGQSGSLFDIGNGLEFTYKNTTGNAKFIIYIENGVTVNNLTFRPMLRKADIDDSTYRPYNNQAIQNQLNAQGVLGAKNLLKNTATSQTINGVTFTVNADGSITANGTATANITNYWMDVFSLKAGKYLISGTPNSIFSVGKTGVRISNKDFSINIFGDEYGTLFTLNNDTSNLKVEIRIASGTTVSNITFKPMLRLASDPDDTYQPYAMTNRELTEEVSNITNNSLTNVTANPNTITLLGSFTLKKGKYIVTAIASMSKQTSDFDISISFSSSATAFGGSRFDSFNGKAPLAADGGIQATKMFNVSSDTTVYVVANHNHSSALALYPAVSIAKV